MSDLDLRLRATGIGGDRLENDYCVLFNGRPIGRIRQGTERVSGWDWVINPPLPIPTWGRGAADDLDAAKTAFREAWDRFYATLTPHEIAH